MHVTVFKPYLAKNYGHIFKWCPLKTCPDTHVAWNQKKYCYTIQLKVNLNFNIRYVKKIFCLKLEFQGPILTTNNRNVLVWSTVLWQSGVNSWIMKCLVQIHSIRVHQNSTCCSPTVQWHTEADLPWPDSKMKTVMLMRTET